MAPHQGDIEDLTLLEDVPVQGGSGSTGCRLTLLVLQILQLVATLCLLLLLLKSDADLEDRLELLHEDTGRQIEYLEKHLDTRIDSIERLRDLRQMEKILSEEGKN